MNIAVTLPFGKEVITGKKIISVIILVCLSMLIAEEKMSSSSGILPIKTSIAVNAQQ